MYAVAVLKLLAKVSVQKCTHFARVDGLSGQRKLELSVYVGQEVIL